MSFYRKHFNNCEINFIPNFVSIKTKTKQNKTKQKQNKTTTKTKQTTTTTKNTQNYCITKCIFYTPVFHQFTSIDTDRNKRTHKSYFKFNNYIPGDFVGKFPLSIFDC